MCFKVDLFFEYHIFRRFNTRTVLNNIKGSKGNKRDPLTNCLNSLVNSENIRVEVENKKRILK